MIMKNKNPVFIINFEGNNFNLSVRNIHNPGITNVNED